MALEEFKCSTSLTLGVELELQLVNLTDYDLTPSANDLLKLLERKTFPGDVKPEMTESMIEVSTDVHAEFNTLREQLHKIQATLLDAGDRLNVGICGGGTHPFQQWSEQRIYPKSRFHDLSTLYGYLAKQFTVFGQHVHIGCSNANEALYLLHALNRYIPHFIALSASSPFYQGVDTLFDSARLNSVFAFPLSGRAPFVLDWAEFEDYFSKMEGTGVVKSMKDFYWDIRPKPEFGTIELRVCDTPLTVERAASLAAYLQAICRFLLDQPTALTEDQHLVYNHNRFQACRFGLDGVMVLPSTMQHISIREDILSTLRAISPHARALNSLHALDEIENIASSTGNHATYLRNQYKTQGSSQALVDASIMQFRGRGNV